MHPDDIVALHSVRELGREDGEVHLIPFLSLALSSLEIAASFQ